MKFEEAVVVVRTYAVALAFALASPPAGAASDYATPYGHWRGQAQFHGRVGADDDPKAHTVADFAIAIEPEGKLTGSSTGTGCRVLGLAAPTGPKTVFTLDVTFSGCNYPGYNRRFSGNLFLYPKDSYASLRLRSFVARNAGSKAPSYDIRATLKR